MITWVEGCLWRPAAWGFQERVAGLMFKKQWPYEGAMSTVMRVKTDQSIKNTKRSFWTISTRAALMFVCMRRRRLRQDAAFHHFQLSGHPQLLSECLEFDDVVAQVGKLAEKAASPMHVFLERRIRKASCIRRSRCIRGFYPDKVKIIVVSGETSREKSSWPRDRRRELHHQTHLGQTPSLRRRPSPSGPTPARGAHGPVRGAFGKRGPGPIAEALAARIFEMKPG
jgi:hypothetical protein